MNGKARRTIAVWALLSIIQPASVAFADPIHLTCAGSAWVKGQEAPGKMSVTIDPERKTVDGRPAEIGESWIIREYNDIESGSPLYHHMTINRSTSEIMICDSRKPYLQLRAGESCESASLMKCISAQRR
jgi:hypothetical protein